MIINIEGRGDFTLSLLDGSLYIEFEGNTILRTIGNPSKPNNPNFTTIEEASLYFNSLPMAKPILPETEEEGVE